MKVWEQWYFLSFQQNLRRSNGHKVEVIESGQLVKILFLLNLDDGMDVDPW